MPAITRGSKSGWSAASAQPSSRSAPNSYSPKTDAKTSADHRQKSTETGAHQTKARLRPGFGTERDSDPERQRTAEQRAQPATQFQNQIAARVAGIRAIRRGASSGASQGRYRAAAGTG